MGTCQGHLSGAEHSPSWFKTLGSISGTTRGKRKKYDTKWATLSRKIRQALATWRESRGQPGAHEIPCLSYCPMAMKRHHDQEQTNKPFNCGTGYSFRGLVHYHHNGKHGIRRAGMGLKAYTLIYRHQR